MVVLVAYSMSSFTTIPLLHSCAADGEGDGEGADGHHQEEGGEEVHGAHADGEGADNEVAVAHADDAEGLLQPADDEAQHQAQHHGHGADEQSLGQEGPPDGAALHAHGTQNEDVVALVDDQQRQRRHEAQRRDEHDERQHQVDAQALRAVDLVVQRLLVVPVLDQEWLGG